MSTIRQAVFAVFGPDDEIAFFKEIEKPYDCDDMEVKAMLLMDSLVGLGILDFQHIDKERLISELTGFLRLHGTRIYPQFYVEIPEELDAEDKYVTLLLTETRPSPESASIFFSRIEDSNHDVINIEESSYEQAYGVEFQTRIYQA